MMRSVVLEKLSSYNYVTAICSRARQQCTDKTPSVVSVLITLLC